MVRFAALALLFPLAAPAANEGRHLPRGEEHPQVIEKVFDSPVGEVQFTSLGASGHSGLLRNPRGHLLGFTEVRGSQDCEAWFLSDKSGELPRGCEVFFYDEDSGRTLSVRGDELEETTLFQEASGSLRGRANVAL